MMRLHLIILSLLIAFCPITSIPANSAGIKRVCALKEGVNLSSQIKTENTIYKVNDNFNLKGAEIVIPKNCVLMFDGGSMENGTISFTDTELCGFPQIDCKLKGSIPQVDITWFGARRDDQTTDVGAVINRVQAVAQHIIIPAGVFYQTNEAVKIEGNKHIDWIGTIINISNKKQFDAFTISSGVVSLDMKGGLECKSEGIDFSNANKTDINGLVVENIKNSKLNIGNIRGFNTGLKVFGHGGGCAYNTFWLAAIRNCNIGLLITQRDKDGKKGWANENTFIGGRFGANTSWYKDDREIHAVVAKGIYKDDSYNKVNSLYFLRPCAEGKYVPFVFHNAAIISVIDCRTEGGVVGAKLSGNTNRVILTNSYGTSLSNLDLSELNRKQKWPIFRQLTARGQGFQISTVRRDAGKGSGRAGPARHQGDVFLLGESGFNGFRTSGVV